MEAKKDGGLAFPMGFHPEGNSADQHGMTLRDYFAGQALAGILAGRLHEKAMDYFPPDFSESPVPLAPSKRDMSSYEMGMWAYDIAKQMIEAKESTL